MKSWIVILVSMFWLRYAAADTVPGEHDDIFITPLVHAGVQLEYMDFVVQVDPWDFLGRVDAKMADLILTTDDSGHHLDLNAIAKYRKENTIVVVTENGSIHVPNGIVMRNRETRKFMDVTVEAVAAYDIIPGEPSHPKGEANGYIVGLGGKRLYFAGVTECVPEIINLQSIDVAFIPMNIPRGRMTPAAAAECIKSISPGIVYIYHYDQGYERRATQPGYTGPELPGSLSILESLEKFESLMAGEGIELRRGNFYPQLVP